MLMMYGQDIHMHQSLLLLCTVKLNCLTVSNCPQTLDWVDTTELLLKFVLGLKIHPATTARLVCTHHDKLQHLHALSAPQVSEYTRGEKHERSVAGHITEHVGLKVHWDVRRGRIILGGIRHTWQYLTSKSLFLAWCLQWDCRVTAEHH